MFKTYKSLKRNCTKRLSHSYYTISAPWCFFCLRSPGDWDWAAACCRCRKNPGDHELYQILNMLIFRIIVKYSYACKWSQWWRDCVKLNEQQDLSVYNLIWAVAAAPLTDWWLGFKVERKSLSAVFENSHVINVCSCGALQDFIRDLQVRWDIWMLQRNIWGGFSADSYNASCQHNKWSQIWSRMLLPWCETPFLCRAACYTEPPAVRICHGGCSGGHRSGQRKQLSTNGWRLSWSLLVAGDHFRLLQEIKWTTHIDISTAYFCAYRNDLM